MTATALLSVDPVIEGSRADDIAAAIEALEQFDVGYETTGAGTVIEAETVSEVFAAAEAAHRAVDADRISTVLKIDDQPKTETSAAEKVEAVETVLGRTAKRDRSKSIQ